MNTKLNNSYLNNISHKSTILQKKVTINHPYYNHRSNFFLKYKNLEQLVKNAKSYLGTPYSYGGDSRIGIDCSSLISNLFKIYNIQLPRLSYKQAKKGFPISKHKLQKGDLLFFSTKFMENTNINHVGIVVDINRSNILFMHASSSNGVIISHIKDPYWKTRFMTARRMT